MRIHSSLSPTVESVVKSKNVLLVKRMLSDIGHNDVGIADYLVGRIKVVGHLVRTGIWKLWSVLLGAPKNLFGKCQGVANDIQTN
eukprot:10521244-Karenia_brevis.AAC.1